MHRDEDDVVLGRAFDRRLVTLLWTTARPHRRLILGTVALFAPSAALELTQPYLLKLAIDEHILRGDWAGLWPIVVAYVAVLGGLYVVRTAEDYLMHVTGQRVMFDLRATLFGHLLSLEAGFFDKNPVGRLMTRVLNDVEAVNDAFTSGLFAVVGDLVTLAGVVAVMLWMDWRLALVTFAIVPLLVAVTAFFRVRARDAYRRVRRRLARLNGYLQESLQGMSVVQLFARERHERAEFERLNAEYRQALFGSTIYEASLYASVEALGAIALGALVWWGGREIAAGTLTFGALVAFIQYTSRFFLPIRDLGAKYTVMQAAMASSERIFGLLERRPAIVSPAAPSVDGETSPALASRRVAEPVAELRNVWFAYQDTQWVLRDCSFTWRSWARPARARRRARACSTGPTTSPTDRCSWRASTSANGISRACAIGSASSFRMRCSSPARSRRTSASARTARSRTPTSSAPWSSRTPRPSFVRCRAASTRSSPSAAATSRTGSGSSSRSRAR